MAKQILDYDPLTGITTSFDYIEDGDIAVVHREQDVSLILDANKAIQNDENIWKQGVKNEWAHYAQIPNIVLEKWRTEHGVDAWKKESWEKNGPVWKLLNSPEYKYLKTTTKFHWG